jgi:diamine N-acetyltransferase
MTSITRANENDAPQLTELAKTSFLESHGHSAEPADVNAYIERTYTTGILRNELADPTNIYYILYYNERAAGYSKIILNSPYENSDEQRITKLERLYLLKEFYGLELGMALFEFNLNLMKENDQKGVWLYVWKENQRAVDFYKKNGFVITGSHDFKLSENHSNPNHRMFLGFK